MKEMQDKIVLITGATSGIGRISAEKFAQMGATVILHGRSQNKLSQALSEICMETGNDKVFTYMADLTSLSDVKRFINEIKKNHEQLDVLINNAGFLGKQDDARIETEDGHEVIFQVNYLSLVLITEGLMNLVTKTKGRIINLASAAQSPIDVNNLMQTAGLTAYAQSKLAVILYSFHLAKRLCEQAMVFALDPGSLLNTNMVKTAFGESERSPTIGSDAQINLACNEELKSATFYCEQELAQAHEQAYNETIQDELWNKTKEILAL